MDYGTMVLELNREPVEVGILVEEQRLSGPFVANHRRRGISISDNARQMSFSADEALTLLAWLQEHEPALRAMVDEEVEAVATVERLQTRAHAAGESRQGHAEGAGTTAEERLLEQEAHGDIRR